MIRHLKIVLVSFVALLGLTHGIGNLTMYNSVQQEAFGILSMSGMFYEPGLWRAIESPELAWIVATIIILGELSVGVVSTKGALDLWAARNKPAAQFNKSKKFAILVCGLGIIQWFGLFMVIGGAYFMMWASELGQLSLDISLQYVGAIGIILLFLNMDDK